MAQAKVTRDLKKENTGWLFLTFLMVMFPALFFLVVFLPIWMGWATPY